MFTWNWLFTNSRFQRKFRPKEACSGGVWPEAGGSREETRGLRPSPTWPVGASLPSPASGVPGIQCGPAQHTEATQGGHLRTSQGLPPSAPCTLAKPRLLPDPTLPTGQLPVGDSQVPVASAGPTPHSPPPPQTLGSALPGRTQLRVRPRGTLAPSLQHLGLTWATPPPGPRSSPSSSCLGAGGPHEGLLERDRTSEAGAVTGAYRGGRTPGNPRGSCGVPTNSLCCIRPSRSSSACRRRHRARPAPPGPDPDAPTAPHRRPGPGACGSPPTHGPPPGSGVMHSAAGRTGSSGVLCGPEGLRGARGAPREPRTSWAAVEVYGALRVTGAPRALRHRGI